MAGERQRAKRAIETESVEAYAATIGTSYDFLRQLCERVRQAVPFVKRRRILFLLDDYSLPRIALEIQRRLNGIVFFRGEQYTFKVAAEKESVFLFAGEAALVEDREFVEIDLGARYLEDLSSTADKVAFLSEIVSARLRNTRDVRVESLGALLGPTPFSWNELAETIRARPQEALYHGMEVLAESCSGDISVTLGVLRQMCETALTESSFDWSRPDCGPIGADIQDRVMRNSSQALLEQFASADERSVRLEEVVNALGELCGWYIRERTSRNEGKTTTMQATRLEVMEGGELSSEARDLYVALLRYCGLVRISRGRSQRGTLSTRLYLRRAFIPAFLLSFSRRDSIRLQMSDLERLLLSPTDFVKQYKEAHTRGGVGQARLPFEERK